MKLVHYSHKPLGPLVSRRQDMRWHGGMKPRGLWVSVDDADGYGWMDWCEAENFCKTPPTHVYDIELVPTHRVLVLDTVESIMAFNQRFKTTTGLTPLTCWPNWGELAGIAQGLIIAPYQWSLRLNNDVFWYYSWDCASGCIWDISAIKSVTERSSYESERDPSDPGTRQQSA